MTDCSDTIDLATELMSKKSVTPEAAGSFDLIESWLSDLGFTVTRLTFDGDGGHPTENLYARRGTAAPNLCFAGHVDVVPPGDLTQWDVPPFHPEVKDGYLYGRGAEDMKGAIACMIRAVDAFTKAHPDHPGSISFLLTADEEGNAINGTKKLLAWLQSEGEQLDYCLVGEPTNPTYIGEMAKIGRRGSLLCELKVYGKQGHVAYPHLADNPITTLVDMLHRLKNTPLDSGSDFFPPSNLEISTVDVGNPSHNSIPAEATAAFNIRFNDQFTGESISQWVRDVCAGTEARYDLNIHVSGESFLTEPGTLSDALVRAVEKTTGHTPELSTTGGTSDARFIKDMCPVMEFGTTGFTPHQINERVGVEALHQLAAVYESFLKELLLP